MEQNENVKMPENNGLERDNLKLCSSCGNRIAKSAKMCPSCGAKNRRPIYMNKFLWFCAAVVLLIGFFNIKSNIESGKSTVKIGGETFTVNEFAEIAEENQHQFSNYVNEYATVTGKVTEVKGGYYHSNLGRHISAEIVIDDEWHFVVDSSSPLLDNCQVGEYTTLTGEIKLQLYGEVYCF